MKSFSWYGASSSPGAARGAGYFLCLARTNTSSLYARVNAFIEFSVRPEGRFLSLSGQRKEPKKGRPGSPALRAPLRCSPHRAAAQLALAKTRGLRQCSPTAPDRAVLLGGSQGISLRLQIVHCQRFLRFSPCEPPSNANEPGGVGEDCLSPCRAAARASSAAARLVE